MQRILSIANNVRQNSLGVVAGVSQQSLRSILQSRITFSKVNTMLVETNSQDHQFSTALTWICTKHCTVEFPVSLQLINFAPLSYDVNQNAAFLWP